MNKNLEILMIDDDPVSIQAVIGVLDSRKITYFLTEATTISQAIEILKKKSFDCILLDYALPDSDGINFFEEFDIEEISVPVIVITSHGDEFVAARFMRMGAYDYLPKSILTDEKEHGQLVFAILDSIERHTLYKQKMQSLVALEMSEERYRGLIEHSAILILRFFHDDRIICFVNDGFCNYFDVERYDVIGENFMSIVPRKHRDFITSQIELLSMDNPTINVELSFGKGQDEKWQKWTIQVIFDRSGNKLEYQCMGEDITSLKKANEMLNNTLDSVNELKEKQDGDYFLTSLILDPLGKNSVRSDNIEIDIFVKEMKEFRFKNWKREVGGDICFAHNIYLEDRIYILFVNADAMGKSMQGAGGAIVVGAVIKAIVDRTKFSAFEQSHSPETWLKNTYDELQRVFESFEGSMLISAVIGLVDDQTGLMYYLNAEHPWTALYRSGKARFIENELHLRKLGIMDFDTTFYIKTFQLMPGDIIIMGSDGRDDFIIGRTSGGERIINEDETRFLRYVEKSKGDNNRIFEELLKDGEITDDFSLLRIFYRAKDRKKKTEKDSSFYINEAQKLQDDLRIDEARDVIKNFLSLHPDDSNALKAMTKLLISSKNYSEATTYVEKYISKCPFNTEYLYVASFCLYKTQNLKGALTLASRAVLRKPWEIRYKLHLAKLHYNNGDYIVAASLVENVLKVRPANVLAIKLQNSIKENVKFLQWKSAYSVSIKIIDKQHRKLISIIAELQHALFYEMNVDKVEKIIEKLNDYTAEHFLTEEKYMYEYDYLEYETHKEQHDIFINRVLTFQKEYIAGKAMLTSEILDFLNIWLVNHILTVDMRYKEFFKNHDLS